MVQASKCTLTHPPGAVPGSSITPVLSQTPSGTPPTPAQGTRRLIHHTCLVSGPIRHTSHTSPGHSRAHLSHFPYVRPHQSHLPHLPRVPAHTSHPPPVRPHPSQTSHTHPGYSHANPSHPPCVKPHPSHLPYVRPHPSHLPDPLRALNEYEICNTYYSHIIASIIVSIHSDVNHNCTSFIKSL